MNVSFRHLSKGMIAASLLAIASPSFAAGNANAAVGASTASASQDATGAKSGGDRLICKRFADTTSRMKSIRACHTKEQWRKIERNEF